MRLKLPARKNRVDWVSTINNIKRSPDRWFTLQLGVSNSYATSATAKYLRANFSGIETISSVGRLIVGYFPDGIQVDNSVIQLGAASEPKVKEPTLNKKRTSKSKVVRLKRAKPKRKETKK